MSWEVVIKFLIRTQLNEGQWKKNQRASKQMQTQQRIIDIRKLNGQFNRETKIKHFSVLVDLFEYLSDSIALTRFDIVAVFTDDLMCLLRQATAFRYMWLGADLRSNRRECFACARQYPKYVRVVPSIDCLFWESIKNCKRFVPQWQILVSIQCIRLFIYSSANITFFY